MVRLYPIKYQKDRLGKVPDDALLYHLLIGQVANEALIFRKQGMVALIGAGELDAPQLAALAVAHLNIKMSGSRLLEAKSLINDVRFKDVRDQVHPIMYAEAKEAHKEINRYFGKSNPIQKLRDKAAFHFDIDLARSALEKISPSDEMIDYFAETGGNCFYGGGAILAAFQLLELSHVADDDFDLEWLLNDVSKITQWFEVYAQGYLLASAELFFKADPKAAQAEMICIEAPDIRSVSAPYFMDDEGVTASDFD